MNGIVLNCLQSHFNTVQKHNNKEQSKKKKFYKAKYKFVGVLDRSGHLVLGIWVQALPSHCFLLQKDYFNG